MSERTEDEHGEETEITMEDDRNSHLVCTSKYPGPSMLRVCQDDVFKRLSEVPFIENFLGPAESGDFTKTEQY